MSGPNYRPIITSFEGPVATIVFNRPEVHNAMDAAAIHAFRAAVDALEFAEPVAVVLHGADGSPFGTGGDLRELADVTDRDEITDLFGTMAGALAKLSTLDCISIAAVDGICIGGAIEIALHCDLRLGTPETQLRFAQGRLGLTTGWGGGARLVDTVGYAKAVELLSLRRTLDAHEALSCGLLNQVIDAPSAVTEAKRWAGRITENVGRSPQGMKRICAAARDLARDTARTVEEQLFTDLWCADVHHDAVRIVVSRMGRSSEERAAQGQVGGAGVSALVSGVFRPASGITGREED